MMNYMNFDTVERHSASFVLYVGAVLSPGIQGGHFQKGRAPQFHDESYFTNCPGTGTPKCENKAQK